MISNAMAGVLHENHKALIARGPWRFDAMVPARYESRPAEGGGTCEAPVCAGSCDICGQGICDVVRFVSAAGERIMIGLDCASTFEHNNGRAFRDAKSGLMKVKREATTRRKGEKLAIVLAPLRAEMTAWISERAGTFHADVAANAIRVMDKGRRPSTAHMALINKLRAEEAPAPRVRPVRAEESHVAAPEGKQTVRGAIVSTKSEQRQYGYGMPTYCYRMTVKVTTDAGIYLVNGTLPRALFDAAEKDLDSPEGYCEALKGCEVEFTATLTRSDDRDFFAFAERPSKARLVSFPAEKAKRSEDVDTAA